MTPPPIPAPDPLLLPLPPGVLKALLLATFTLHLMAVNLGVGGSLILAVHALLGGPRNQHLVRKLAPLLPAAVTFAITLGVAPLLFLQLIYGPFFYTASVLTAVPWLALIGLLMGGYALVYRFVGASGSAPVHAFNGIVGALLFLLAGLSFVNVTTLSLRPDLWVAQAAASSHGLSMNTSDPTLWPRFLHLSAGIVAVAGLAMAAWGTLVEHAWARQAGLRWFIGATASQAAFGTWLLVAQPAALQEHLLNGGSTSSLTMWIAIACGALALLMVIPASQDGAPPGSVWTPLGLGIASVLGMILLRDQARDASLATFGFHPGSLPYRTDWLSLGVFCVVLIGVLVLLFMGLRWILQPQSAAPGPDSEAP